MKKVLFGSFERVLGTASVDAKGEWVLDPHEATPDDLALVVNRVFTRVQRRQPRLTRAQFVNQFFTKKGGTAAAYASSAWGQSYKPPEVQALINRLCPADDPYMVELYRLDQERLAHFQQRQRA